MFLYTPYLNHAVTVFAYWGKIDKIKRCSSQKYQFSATIVCNKWSELSSVQKKKKKKKN